ncbi:MAG: general secretion pathway protein [Burkholderiaceae bacterium]|nr:MAG: general secretion pathway protein [Burkholderiaceae bacterium]TAM02263.1 MAG: general secretion pathway protein [Pusillimonas sp.]
MRPPRFSFGLETWIEQVVFGLDRIRFAAQRADYFEYLAVLIERAHGRLTVKSIFEQDARRYRMGTVRGRLSHRWARAYQMTGGDLYATWLGCFSLAELSLVRVAQLLGNRALTRTLSELADAITLVRQASGAALATLWSAALGLCVLLAMVMAVPLYTVPQLRRVFSAVPAEFHGVLTRSLFRFSELVQSNWAVALGLGVGVFCLLVWSLPNLTGRVRCRLDGWSVWRIYRSVQAVRFLALTTIVLAHQDSASTQLRTALAIQRVGGSPWLRWHLDAMLARVDAGMTGAHTFDTGVLDRDLYWFLCDMASAHGLAHALVLVRQRLKGRILGAIVVRARAMRWAVLLGCLAGLVGMALWHYAVIDELRRSLMFFYASQ